MEWEGVDDGEGERDGVWECGGGEEVVGDGEEEEERDGIMDWDSDGEDWEKDGEVDGDGDGV